jgi:pyruvate dehydrogenase E2 component (dihydrolipoamide acetyltransferase)
MATNILMPALSPTMEEGKLAKWLVKEGDAVKSGDILCEIETDKATMEFEAVDEGTVGKILILEGAEGVKVNTPIAVLLGEGEAANASVSVPQTDIPSAMQSIAQAVTAAEPAVASARASAEAAPAPAGTRIFASPLAKRIAAQRNIDLAGVSGSGPRGRIVKADVEAAIASPSVAPIVLPPPAVGQAQSRQVPPAPQVPLPPDARLFYQPTDYVEVPNDAMRRAIAKRLSAAAATIPHVAISVDCELDALLAVRAGLNAASPKENGYKLSVNDFVLKAAAAALMAVPEINASWTDAAILRHKHADIGVAVALPTGLITPIVTHTEEKGLKRISEDVSALVARARERKLKPNEYEGGTFSVSNLGMFAVTHFTSIVNPPQGAILSVGAGEERAVVKDGKLAAATVMTVTLSLDHRIADGAAGARFLQAFRRFIEQPATMLL